MLNRTKGQLKSRTFLGPNCLDQKRAHDWPSKENSLEVTPVDSESLKVRPHWKHQMKTVKDGNPASTSTERSKPKSETGRSWMSKRTESDPLGCDRTSRVRRQRSSSLRIRRAHDWTPPEDVRQSTLTARR